MGRIEPFSRRVNLTGRATRANRDGWNPEGHRNVGIGGTDIQLRFQSQPAGYCERRLNEFGFDGGFA